MKLPRLGWFCVLMVTNALAINTQEVMEYQCLEANQYSLSYFHPRLPPDPIPYSHAQKVVCHDVEKYGPMDNHLFPRLKQRLSDVKLWDSTDVAFYDTDGDGYMDVNSYVKNLTKKYGGNVGLNVQWFKTLGAPKLTLNGFIMSYWIDTATATSFCPTKHHFRSGVPLYRAFGDVLEAQETEGLYVGQRLSDRSEVKLISETELKKIWFHIADGIPVTPISQTVAKRPVYFVSDAEVYQVKGGNELVGWEGSPTQFPAHDRKIGCIPKQHSK